LLLGKKVKKNQEKFSNPEKKIRLQFSNVIAISGILIEAIQLCAFTFNVDVFPWPKAFFVTQIFRGFIFDFGEQDIFFYFVFCICLFWFIFVLSLHTSFAELCASLSIFQLIFAYILPFIGKPLFMPIIRVLLKAFDCNYSQATITWSEDPSLICWKDQHLGIAILSAIGLIMYYPFAIRLLPAWQYLLSNLDIHYSSSYLIVSYQIKFILVFFTVFFSYIPPFYLSVCVIGISTLVILQCVMKPASSKKINYWRMIFLCCVLWELTCSLITYFLENSIVPTILLLVGWGLILILGLLLSHRTLTNDFAHKSKALVQLTTLNPNETDKTPSDQVA